MIDEADEPTRRIARPLEAPERTRSAGGNDWIGIATDIGQRHPTNQDAYAWTAPEGDGRRAVLVVSDGVTSSLGAELASATAAATVRDTLVELEVDPAEVDPSAALVQAFAEANRAVLANGQQGQPVGSCTLIAGVVSGPNVAIGNIGDTRAYWFPDAGEPVQLSVDDSMAQAQIELGMSREEAETSLHAHAITKWIGPDAPDPEPRISRMRLEGPGWLMLCSDGLWNYASTPQAIGEVLRQFAGAMPPADPPSVLARALVGWANAQGGRDNITVALARL